MKFSMIVYLFLIFHHNFHNCENNLHYLEYIPENELGERFICVLFVTQLIYIYSIIQSALFLLGGITYPEVMGRTVPTVKAASLLFYDGMSLLFFSESTTILFPQEANVFLIYPLMSLLQQG